MVHDSFNISESVLKGFEQANNVKVNLLKSGDAGAVLNKAILSKDAPIADVIYGIDNTFMSRALNADILEVFAPAELSAIPEAYKLDASNRLTPVNYGYVSFNMDKAWLTKPGSTQPDSLRALARPEYLHTVVVQNAATSSPGLAFLMTTIAAFPAGSDYPWQQFWRDLVKNQAHVSPDWSDAYYTQFSGSSGKGPHAIVMSYATSPAAEVFYSEGKLSEPPTVNLDIGAFEQIEFAGVLKGTKQRELSQKFVAFLLSPEFQKDIPAQMWVYPAVKDTPLPDVYRFAAKPSKIYSLPPSEIDANRERWIQEWSKIIAGG
jgi:thiamine transport system substrate-binding protein